MAAKLCFPALGFREALLIGGYTDEELDVVTDQKNRWRTRLVNRRDTMRARIKKFHQAKIYGSLKSVKGLVEVLESDAEDRLGQVFGERVGMFERFMRAAEERGEGEPVERHRPTEKGWNREENSTRGDEDEACDDETFDAVHEEENEQSDGARGF